MGQYTSYWLYQKYETRDNQTIPVYPNYWSIDADGTLEKVIKIDNDPACGYVPPTPATYRWVNLDPTKDYYCDDCPEVQYRWYKAQASDYACVGVDKHYKEYYQVSYDGGYTWQNVVPEQTRTSSDVIEYNSVDCGYVPPTAETIYRWVQTQLTICVEDGPTPPPPTPTAYTEQYFTVVPNGNGTIKKLSGGTFSYSYDSGTTWNTATSATSISMTSGQKIMFKGTETPVSDKGIGSFSASTTFDIEGNTMSLLFGDIFSGQTDISGKDYSFQRLFSGCTGLTSIANLVLPATTLAQNCYYAMFRGCSSLTSIPSGFLPATTLASGCCEEMFDGCTSLTTVPSDLLPATTLVNKCYQGMFYGCTSLTTAPDLPALVLVWRRQTIGHATLITGCYQSMFNGCTNLSYVKCLAKENIGSNGGTRSWMVDVSANGTFVKNPEATWPTGTDGIPTNWTVQDYTG